MTRKRNRMPLVMAAVMAATMAFAGTVVDYAALAEGFAKPPLTARPGVYWYFMDGNYSREGVTRDLEAMRTAGIAQLGWIPKTGRIDSAKNSAAAVDTIRCCSIPPIAD